jgi:hypothetical protein
MNFHNEPPSIPLLHLKDPDRAHGALIARSSVAAWFEWLESGVSMSRPWKIAILLMIILLFGIVGSLAWSAPQGGNESRMPVFTGKDHKLIEDFYLHWVGTLAPGSLDRSAFPLGVEQSLATGSHVPMQLEQDLKLLPAKLESQLSQLTGEYGRYTLGRHVLLVRKGDLAIADIIKNIAAK